MKEKKEMKMGVDVEVVKTLCVVDQIIEDEKTHWLCIDFLIKMKNENFIPQNVEPETHKEMKWFGFDELPSNLTISSKKAINCYLKEYRKNLKEMMQHPLF